MSQFLVAAPVVVVVVVVVISVAVPSVCDPVPLVVAVAMLVAVMCPKFVVIVPDVAVISGLFGAVSWAVAVLVPIVLFHIDAVLSLSPFLCQSPACLLASDLIHLLLLRCHACLLSIACLCCLFVF